MTTDHPTPGPVADGPDGPTGTSGPGPLALVGSGEFLPGMRSTDERLLDGRPARVAVLATASAPEGPAVVRRWQDLARDHYAALGATAVAVPVADRAGADDPANVALLEGAGLIYLSGGNPAYLAATLRGTAVWAAIERAWWAGTAVAGCSAGAMAMGGVAFSPRGLDASVDGLGLVPPVGVLPHFDRIRSWQPDLFSLAVEHVADRVTVVGVDEDTAAVWIPGSGAPGWRVEGVGSVWLPTTDGAGPRPFGPGTPAPLPDPRRGRGD